MTDNYQKLALNNLAQLYTSLPPDLADSICAERQGDRFIFNAFGEKCIIEPGKITFEKQQSSIHNLLVSLYALHATPEKYIPEPLKSFKDFPDSTPYVGAFSAYTEKVLAPHVTKIRNAAERIKAAMTGQESLQNVGGDFSFTLFPLPKISLSYIFYEADDEFPASVTCLYSSNANRFMPIDGLADVGEYTSKTILRLL